jgi:hypothetical protein
MYFYFQRGLVEKTKTNCIFHLIGYVVKFADLDTQSLKLSVMFLLHKFLTDFYVMLTILLGFIICINSTPSNTSILDECARKARKCKFLLYSAF